MLPERRCTRTKKHSKQSDKSPQTTSEDKVSAMAIEISGLQLLLTGRSEFNIFAMHRFVHGLVDHSFIINRFFTATESLSLNIAGGEY